MTIYNLKQEKYEKKNASVSNHWDNVVYSVDGPAVATDTSNTGNESLSTSFGRRERTEKELARERSGREGKGLETTRDWATRHHGNFRFKQPWYDYINSGFSTRRQRHITLSTEAYLKWKRFLYFSYQSLAKTFKY